MNLQYFYDIPFFSGLSEETLKKVMILFEQANFKKGDYVVKFGDEAKGMYVVIYGDVEVLIDDKHVADLGESDFFGELALITNEPRTASVKVVSDKFQAFYLTKEVFESAKNELSEDVKQEILRRIKENFDNSAKMI